MDVLEDWEDGAPVLRLAPKTWWRLGVTSLAAIAVASMFPWYSSETRFCLFTCPEWRVNEILPWPFAVGVGFVLLLLLLLRERPAASHWLWLVALLGLVLVVLFAVWMKASVRIGETRAETFHPAFWVFLVSWVASAVALASSWWGMRSDPGRQGTAVGQMGP